MNCIKSVVALEKIKAKDVSRTFFKEVSKAALTNKKLSNSSVAGYALEFPRKRTSD